MTLGGHFEFIGADQKHVDQRREVARQTVIDDKVLTHLDGCFFQHSLIYAARHANTTQLIMVITVTTNILQFFSPLGIQYQVKK